LGSEEQTWNYAEPGLTNLRTATNDYQKFLPSMARAFGFCTHLLLWALRWREPTNSIRIRIETSPESLEALKRRLVPSRRPPWSIIRNSLLTSKSESDISGRDYDNASRIASPTIRRDAAHPACVIG